MPTDENTRLRIRQYLIDLMDNAAADAMMESMPPIPWTELATKDDIADLRGDMARMEVGLRDEVTQLDTSLRGEITQLDTSLRGEITQLGREITGLKSAFGHEMVGLEGRMSKQIAESTRMVVLSMMLLMVGVIGAFAAFVNLG